MSFGKFYQLPLGWTLTKIYLQESISRIRDSTLEKGQKIGVDYTAVKSDICHPWDFQLLYDSIRKVTVLLQELKTT